MVLLSAFGIDHAAVDNGGAFGIDIGGIGGNDFAGDFAYEIHGVLVAFDGLLGIGGGIGVLASLFEIIFAESGYFFDFGMLKIELQTFVVAIVIHGLDAGRGNGLRGQRCSA